MGSSLERIAVGIVVFSTSILSIVGLLAIWEFVNSDFLWKSFSTIGVIGLAALVVIGISRVANSYNKGTAIRVPAPEPAAWRSMRNQLLTIIGLAFLFFAGLSILSIWNFVGSDSLMKAVESMFLLCSSAVVMLVAFKSQLE
jgi:hypothetical protein